MKTKRRWLVIERFADEMQRRLDANTQKGGANGRGWSGDNFEGLFDRLLDEASELREAWQDGEEVSPHEIREEAADVAAFAMMIADNWGDLRRRR